MTISSILKTIRKENQWSQVDLAKELQVSRSAIARWESNTGFPDIDNLLLLSQKFDISLDTLIKGDYQEQLLVQSKRRRKLQFYRSLTSQLTAFCLFLLLISKTLFQAPLLVQICYLTITCSTLALHLYWLTELKQFRIQKQESLSLVKQQLLWTLVTLTTFCFSLYKTLTTSDNFQKIVSIIATTICAVLTLLVLWGIKTAMTLQKRQKHSDN